MQVEVGKGKKKLYLSTHFESPRPATHYIAELEQKADGKLVAKSLKVTDSPGPPAVIPAQLCCACCAAPGGVLCREPGNAHLAPAPWPHHFPPAACGLEQAWRGE